MRISSKTKEGIPELWTKMQEFRDKMEETGRFETVRENQHTVWMWNHIRDNIMKLFMKHPTISANAPKLEKQVAKGVVTPGLAADILLKEFKKTFKS